MGKNAQAMNHKLGPETRERLHHALARLQAEPRSGERRTQERRKVVSSWTFVEERRRSDRRKTDRRGE